jgi:TIM21
MAMQCAWQSEWTGPLATGSLSPLSRGRKFSSSFESFKSFESFDSKMTLRRRFLSSNPPPPPPPPASNAAPPPPPPQQPENDELKKQEESSGAANLEVWKERIKTGSYAGVALIFLGAALAVVGAVLWQLFGASSPQRLYGKTAKRVKSDQRVLDYVGDHPKAHGEGQRRRNHIRSKSYKNSSNEECVRLSFYVTGSKTRAEVTADWINPSDGSGWRYNFLVVDIPAKSRRLILIQNGEDVVSMAGL